jgi:hypothetical protein
MRTYGSQRTPSSDTGGGQVGVKATFQPNINSRTSGGQAPVRQTTEGDRGGDLNARGCVSPLGGVMNQGRGDASPPEESRERPGTRSY